MNHACVVHDFAEFNNNVLFQNGLCHGGNRVRNFRITFFCFKNLDSNGSIIEFRHTLVQQLVVFGGLKIINAGFTAPVCEV